MKKLIYEDEKINPLWLIIICLFYLPLIYMVWYIIFNSNIEEKGSNVVFAIMWFVIITYFLYYYVKDAIKTRKKYKYIKEHGEKYSAYIENFNYKTYIKSSARTLEDAPQWYTKKEFTLNVSYTNKNGEKEVYTTPILGFNPIKDLASRNCNIYKYENELYVTDFEMNNTDEYLVWSKESKEVQNMLESDSIVKKERNGLIKYSLIIFGLSMLILIALVLLAYGFGR